ITHPDVRGGQECRALTAHIDIAPTLLSMAGIGPGRAGELAGRDLPGKDLTLLLNNPGSAGVNAVREGVLFIYSGLVTVDADPLEAAARALAAGKDLPTALKRGDPPDPGRPVGTSSPATSVRKTATGRGASTSSTGTTTSSSSMFRRTQPRPRTWRPSRDNTRTSC